MEILKAEKFEFNYQVQEKDLDVFGHVNNANYLNYYEMARWDFITKNSFGLDLIMKERKGPVLLGVDLQFRRELKNRDQIVITSQAEKIDSRKFFHLYQEMIRVEDQKLASKATFTVAYFDLNKRKMLAPDEKWLKACGITLK